MMKYYMVDAFADELFRGNPAGVCLLDHAIPDTLMQKIAFENNLAETAFLLHSADALQLRWFTPEVEIDLCGHATLATAFVVMNYVETNLTQVAFQTKSGTLTVTRNGDLFTMNFPSRMPAPVETDLRLEGALHCRVLETYLSRDLVVVVENEAAVQKLIPDINALAELSRDIAFSVIVTAKGDSCDFVSRFFAPNAGISEDPVTGSAHSTLAPFWGQRLGKANMVARQLSQRGGTIICQCVGDRVNLSGKAVCYLVGQMMID